MPSRLREVQKDRRGGGAAPALREQYEQYFLGVERKPPARGPRRLKKRLAGCGQFPRRTRRCLRVESLTASASTYERLWARTLQEMEDGTYRRDIFKARMRRKGSAPEVPAAPPASATAPGPKQAATGKAAAVAQSATPQPQVPPPEPHIDIAGTAPPDPLAETRLRSVYRAYVEASVAATRTPPAVVRRGGGEPEAPGPRAARAAQRARRRVPGVREGREGHPPGGAEGLSISRSSDARAAGARAARRPRSVLPRSTAPPWNVTNVAWGRSPPSRRAFPAGPAACWGDRPPARREP